MFRVLGHLDVSEEEGAAGVRGLRQRAVLGYILLHHGSPVTVARLEQALWPSDAPPTGRQVVYNAVHALRRAGLPLEKHAGGYQLGVAPDRLDVVRFQLLLARGRTDLANGHWEAASRVLREALSLWRGQALADLAEQGLYWREMAALNDSRLTALEYRVEAEFRMGRHRDVLGELEAVVEAEPLRERLCGQLMEALYHSGRQADALRLYRRTRTGLNEQLGLEPSPALRELEHAILNHELRPEPAPPAVPLPRTPAGRPVPAPVSDSVTVRSLKTGRHAESERLVREHAGIDPDDCDEIVAAKIRWVVRRALDSGDLATVVRCGVIDLLAGIRNDETLRAGSLLLDRISQLHQAEAVSR
ncbi:AfsR/SARP family transcriptional regulator [Streptomyces sp. NPDC051657]|uniref:AfsR/SARP family transcriptional regulator n=1 Tax=unclassified Streptomyces TaxID=2593676 RepID=UPI00342B3BFF